MTRAKFFLPEPLPNRAAERKEQQRGPLSSDLRPGESATLEELRVRREDEEMRRTGIVQSERQVFELAREHFGSNEKGGAE